MRDLYVSRAGMEGTMRWRFDWMKEFLEVLEWIEWMRDLYVSRSLNSMCLETGNQ